MNIVASIEARMTSTRLPGKVLMTILDKPILEYIIERLQCSKYITDIVVATTTNEQDNAIQSLCNQLHIKCYRGNEDDVLGRLVDAHQYMNTNIIVEITGDSPVIDPAIVDRTISEYLNNTVDYVSNTIQKTFPIGMRSQVFSFDLLKQISTLTQDKEDREHVTSYIYRNPSVYKILNVSANNDEFWPDLRLTLDYPEDFEVIKFIIEQIYPEKNTFGLNDIIQLMKKYPEIVQLNSQCIQKIIRS